MTKDESKNTLIDTEDCTKPIPSACAVGYTETPTLNQIYCEDWKNTVANIGNAKLGLILTDPPFGQGLNYGRAQLGHRTVQNDDNLRWLPTWATEMYRILRNDKHCLVFWQWRTYSQLEEEMFKVGFDLKTVAVWDKNNAGLGDGIAEQYEQICVFRKGNARQTKFCGNVFRYNRIAGRPFHPHQKPVPLLKKLIDLTTDVNDIVYDSFAGSGGYV